MYNYYQITIFFPYNYASKNVINTSNNLIDFLLETKFSYK